MSKTFVGLLSLIIFVLFFSAEASARHVKNGLPCHGSSQCSSGYCSDRLPYGKVAGEYLCMDRTKNCPIPGGPGVMFEGEYNFGRSHWFCMTGKGIQHDGPSRSPEFYYGGPCSGFWKKIDCRGKWFPLVSEVLNVACFAAKEPVSQSFCAAASITKKFYDKQR